MGLSAPKKRTKISNDPNNLAWVNSTDGVGHRMLVSNGWKPGEYLGPKNAAHAEHYTEANASSIRVVLRETGLGIGAQIGKGNAETFGLSMFSGLLGRLNGKSDAELQTQQNLQRDVELRMYQAHKFGSMNFVYGGLLVGDKMDEGKLGKASTLKETGKLATVESSAGHAKRKLQENENESSDNAIRKKQKKEKKRLKAEVTGEKSKEKKNKKKQQKRGSTSQADEESVALNTAVSEDSASDSSHDAARLKKAKKKETEGDQSITSSDKKLRKQEKKAQKEERRRIREERRKRKAERRSKAVEPPTVNPVADSVVMVKESVAEPKFAPTAVNRHAARHRYIQQKRMASLDAQALKEIFMIKATA